MTPRRSIPLVAAITMVVAACTPASNPPESVQVSAASEPRAAVPPPTPRAGGPIVADPVLASYTGREIRASELATYFFAVYRQEAFAALSKMIGVEIVEREARRIGLEMPPLALEEQRRLIDDQVRREAAMTYGIGTTPGQYTESRFRRSLVEHVAYRLEEARQRWLFARIIRYHAISRDRVALDLIVVRDEALAREIAEKLDQGADFGRLAATHSIHDSAQREGRLAPLPKEALHPAVGDRAFELPVGTRSGVLAIGNETATDQFEIIRVRERIPAREASWVDLRDEIERGLAERDVDVDEWTAWYRCLERLYKVRLADSL